MEGSNITIALAFLAGLASFLSPCVLPLVPGYISLISGVSIDHLKGEHGSQRAARRAVVVNSLAFNVGLSLIFVALGAAAGYVGAAVLSNAWVRIVGGFVIIGFGLQLIGLLKIGALYRDTRKFSDEKPRGPLGALALGMAFAAGWTPCIGPILGGIIGLAATSGGWKSGLILSSFYSAGLAVPFLLTGLLLNQFLGFYTWFRQHLHKVEVISGVMLIAIGLLVMSNNVTRMAGLAARFIPNAEGWVQKLGTDDKTSAQQIASNATNKPATSGAANNASFETAPDVQLTTLEGQPYDLKSLRGRIVLLNFWATWCGPCRAEIPDFNAMQREYDARGFSVVGVSTYDTPEQIKDFQQTLKQEYTVLTGGEDASAKFATGPGLPVTFFIDRQGRIRKKIIGGGNRATFEAALKPLLDEPLEASSAAAGTTGGN
ncbi:MAG TPA: cytochrome c biogenesis protein CcdA [Pyrinomonadaceae bacterium]|jgi:cytochrome c-type biogenesis protein|nr:cytochrome c biogenesis protein CcdA [Pyrinomonadaceae bacterium]